MAKNKLKREFSAGCVVFKPSIPAERDPALQDKYQVSSIKYLIGKHSGYHKWVLPKGLIEEGEKGWETALRETEEEMNVKGELVLKKPIHKEKYFFWANYKDNKKKDEKRAERRVNKYQEQGGEKTKVLKTVSFYLAKYKSGDPKNHGWEMEEAGWYGFDEALDLMAFDGEKEALKKAKKEIGRREWDSNPR